MLPQLPAPVGINTLRAMRSAPPGGYDVKVGVLTDVVTYPQIGTNRLDFFLQTTADPTLSNLQPAGQLVIGQWFRGVRIFLEFLGSPTSGAAVAGIANDIMIIKHAARGMLIYRNNTTQRLDVPIPISFLGAPSNTDVFLSGTQAAGTTLQSGAQAANGGYPWDEVILGGETFGFTMQFQPTLQPISVALNLRLSIYGQRYVPVSGS